MRILGLCAVLAIATSPLLAQDDPVQQVLSVRAGIGPAMRAKDTAALEKIWSPQMKVNSPGNSVMDRSAVLKLLSEATSNTAHSPTRWNRPLFSKIW